MAAMYDQLGNYIGDDGLDAAVKPLEQTQATSPNVPAGVNNGLNVYTEDGGVSNLRRNPETGELYDPGGPAGYAISPMQAGVAAREDSGTTLTGTTVNGTAPVEGTTPSSAGTAGTFNTNLRQAIVPRGNVLDRFSSYSYCISVYLMSPEQYTQLVLSRKKNISGLNLLFQSGGAPAGQRNPDFDVDFYIDTLTINNLIQGKSTGSAHGVSDLKFTVIEPNGITLIDRIYAAVQKFAPADAAGKGINYGNSHYLMAIRWYGYDSEGNVQKVGAADPKTGLTDPNAAVEKFIPFMINGINFTVSSRSVSYEFDCTATSQLISAGSRRGAVPYDIQLGATTVKELLDGQSKYMSDRNTSNATNENQSDAETRRLMAANAAAAAKAPAKANAIAQAKKVVTGGLMAALTQYQKVLTEGERPIFDEYDEYYIEFTPRAQAIANAKLVIPGSNQEAKTSENKPAPSSSSNSANPKTDGKSNQTKTKSIVAGQAIVQVIDQVIRNSTFITEQQLTQINSDNEEEPNPNARNKPVNWFSITFKAVTKKYDFLRNDYSYKITYVIDLYTIDKYDSKYFPIGTYRGVHKVYPWWFTGQNTAVIEYNETLNTAFNMVVSGTTPETSAAETQRRKIAATQRDIYTYVYGAGSDESRQGAESKAFEGAANLADSLYGGADLAECKLKIIGDPAWIQQGSLSGGVSVAELASQSFLPDGTINFDGEQPMFEVQWNRPADYNLDTGLQTPNSGKSQLAVSRVYQAATATSEFRQGKFEQTITGLLYQIPKPDGSNKAPTAPPPAPSQVDIARNAPPGQTVKVNGHLMTNTRGPDGATQWYERGAIVYRTPNKTPLPEPASDAATAVTSSTPTPDTTSGDQGTQGGLSNRPTQVITYDEMGNPITGVSTPTPSVQPALPPKPPTDGSGQNISWLDRALNAVSRQKISESDMAPSTPQDQARDA